MYKTCTTTNVEKWIRFYFLGAFTKLRKAAIGIVMSVCPSVCLHGKKRPPTGWNSMKILCLSIFRKSSEKIKFSLKSNKNNERFT